MKLEEAIEIGTDSYEKNTILYTARDKKALKLLIEAGKRILENRYYAPPQIPRPLPGETKETTPSHRLPLGGITLELPSETKD